MSVGCRNAAFDLREQGARPTICEAHRVEREGVQPVPSRDVIRIDR